MRVRLHMSKNCCIFAPDFANWTLQNQQIIKRKFKIKNIKSITYG